MRADVLKRSVIGVEIKARQDVARLMAFGQSTNPRPQCRRELAHLVVAVDVGSDQHGLGVDHFHHQDLVMMAIVGGDARQAPGSWSRRPTSPDSRPDIALETRAVRRDKAAGSLRAP